jgi:TRAP-type uncharacterized transport system substrate-binding protein
MKTKSILALAALSVAALFSSCATAPRPVDSLRVAGKLDGAYEKAMQGIARVPTVKRLSGVESPGSKLTLTQIKSGVVDAGLIQGDTDLGNSNVSAVREVHSEVFFILSKTKASAVSELVGSAKGRALKVGGLKPGSQTMIDAKRVFEAASAEDIEYVGGDHTESLARLKSGEIDAIMFITAPGSTTLSSVRSDTSLHLVPVNVTPWKGTELTTLPAGAVLRHAPAVKTLQTPSLLVVSNNTSAALVSQFCKALDANKAAVKKHAPFVQIEKVPASLGVPVHAGAN